MSTQELMILFIGVVIVAGLAVTTMTGQIRAALGTSESVTQQASRQVSTEMSIVSVYSNGTDTNIFIKGISGQIDVNNATVLINGSPVTPLYRGFVRDSGAPGVLDPGDAYIIEVPGSYDDRDCIIVDTPSATAVWGLCS